MTTEHLPSERAQMLRAEDELSKAIGALPLPWGDTSLDAPLARIREAIDKFRATTPRPADRGEREAWIDGAAWASMDNDEITVADIEAAADDKFGPEAVPSDDHRLDWLVSQTQPHHGVILCALDLPDGKWASVQRVNQFHNPHKVEWCFEGITLRDAIDKAMRDAETITIAPDDTSRTRPTPQAAPDLDGVREYVEERFRCRVCDSVLEDGAMPDGDDDFDATMQCGNVDCPVHGMSAEEGRQRIFAVLRPRRRPPAVTALRDSIVREFVKRAGPRSSFNAESDLANLGAAITAALLETDR